MAELKTAPARFCWTAAGVLIHDGKVLLVKHKKLGLWLAPGGHLEADELPHEAAEREFWEEAGIKVQATDAFGTVPSVETQYLPNPILTNLHWISRENYLFRTQGTQRSAKTKKDWGSKGCEQHLNFIYLVKPLGSLEYHNDEAESTDIGWFTEAEVASLSTLQDIKSEVSYAFSLMKDRS